MKHADRLAERILFLDGLPNFQALGRLRIGENVEEILKADLELEMEAVPQLTGAIAHCEKVRDYVSRDLFSEILENEEEHVDLLETQFEMIARMGLQNYIQLAVRGRRRAKAAAGGIPQALRRYLALDVVRGVAVMGILLANIRRLRASRLGLFLAAGLGRHGTGEDLAAWLTTFVFVEGKMRGLFSFLFGASMLLVIERAEAAGEVRRRSISRE